MNWLNLRTETLHAPEFIGSDPTARGTWIALMFYCAQQENGGVIVGAAAWSDRQWQQTCGVTRAEVDAAAKLTRWAGDDLHVFAYPIDQEAAFAAMSSGGRAGGLAKARNRLKQATAQGPLVAPLEPGALAKGREGKGKEGKEKADSAATSAEVLADRGGEAQLELVPESAQQPAPPATPPVLTFPCSGKVAQWHLTDAFLAELRAAYPSIDPLAEAKVALLKVTVGAVTRKTAGGMTRFLCSWMDRATNGRPAAGPAQARQGAQPQQSAFVPRPSLGALQIELRAVREEIADILHPGGCSGTVEPKGAKRERYDALVARRNRIQAQIEQAA